MRLGRLKIARRAIASVFAAALLASCSSLYPHDPGVEKSTADNRDTFDSFTTKDVKEIFDREASYLQQFDTSKRDAVIASMETLRTRRLLTFLHGDETRSGGDALKEAIDDQLTLLVGRTDSDKLLQLVQNSETDFVRKAKTVASYEGLVARYQRAGGRNDTDCTAVTQSGGPEQDNDDAAMFYGFIVQTCKQIDEIKPVNLSTSPPAADSSYEVGMREVSQTKADIADKKMQRDKLAHSLSHDEEELKNALTPKADATLLGKLAALRTTLTDNLKAANPYIRQYVSERLATNIETVITAVQPAADAGSTSTSSTTTAEVRAALGLINGIAGVADAFADPPRVPHPNALAVGLAHMKYVRDSADAEIAFLEAQVPRAQDKLDAVVNEVWLLSKAKEAARKLPSEAAGTGLADLSGDPGSASAVEAIYAYSKAWTEGHARYRMLVIDEEIAKRRYSLEQNQRAADAWTGILKPGFDTLAKYGAGGIDPQTVATLLGFLGGGALIGR